MDAGDRGLWRGEHDESPLSDLGRRQAEALRGVLTTQPIDALYASSALRARQTLEPIALETGRAIETLAALAEEQRGETGRELAERAETAFHQIRALGTGRAVAASHGDLIPALAARIGRSLGVDVAPMRHRGQWYRVEVTDVIQRIQRLEVPDFPR